MSGVPFFKAVSVSRLFLKLIQWRTLDI